MTYFLDTSALLDNAAQILQDRRAMPLRTLDALQFAFFVSAIPSNSVFASADTRLLAVVAAAGHATLHPEH